MSNRADGKTEILQGTLDLMVLQRGARRASVAQAAARVCAAPTAQSAALCHVGNISWRLGKSASPAEIRAELSKLAARETALDALDRTLQHLGDNGVDLDETPLTLGARLEIDGGKEAFAKRHAKANELLTREYRKPFVVPAESQV